MTTVHAAPPLPATDPRDPEDRLQRFFDDGSMSLLVPRDTSGVMAARGTVSGTPTVAFCTDATVMGGAMGVDGCRHIVDAIDTALREQVVPATANLDDPDDDANVQSLDIVRREPRRTTLTAAVNDSFGFGGHNIALVFTTA